MARHFTVRHPSEHGWLAVETSSGIILTPPTERPKWARGLVLAMLVQRTQAVDRAGTRLGHLMRFPDPIDYREFGWLAADADGNYYETKINPDGAR